MFPTASSGRGQTSLDQVEVDGGVAGVESDWLERHTAVCGDDEARGSSSCLLFEGNKGPLVGLANNSQCLVCHAVLHCPVRKHSFWTAPCDECLSSWLKDGERQGEGGSEGMRSEGVCLIIWLAPHPPPVIICPT